MSKKGENIYKRKDGRWEARYIREYRLDGKPKYGYCYGKTYREAKQKVTAAKSAWLLGQSGSTYMQKKHFSYFCDEWLKTSKNRVKESTYVKYCGMMEKHIKPCLGGYLVSSLDSETVENFSRNLLSEERLAPKTVKDILTVLHSVIQYTIRQVPGSMSQISIVYPRIPKTEMRVLTREEQTHLVQFLLEDMDEYEFGILLALLTGMRIGEVCALRWENISLQEQIIAVKCTMQRLHDYDSTGDRKTKIRISEPKSDHSTRVIPLTEYTVKLCRAIRRGNPAAFVLTGQEDHYIEPRTMQYRLARYTKECGLSGVHFHTLRHTFATRCVEVDFEIKSLSEILGHSSPRITLERYVHSSLQLKRDNMNKLAAIGY